MSNIIYNSIFNDGWQFFKAFDCGNKCERAKNPVKHNAESKDIDYL